MGVRPVRPGQISDFTATSPGTSKLMESEKQSSWNAVGICRSPTATATGRPCDLQTWNTSFWGHFNMENDEKPLDFAPVFSDFGP